MKRLSWIFWVGLKCKHRYPFKKETEEYRKESCVTT